MPATRTYLEMTERSALQAPRACPRTRHSRSCARRTIPIRRCGVGSTPRSGRGYRWIDRLPWTDEEAQRVPRRPADVSLWLLDVDGADRPATSSCAASRTASVEIVYFGLLPEFMGRRLGGHLLTEAVERAWRSGARRVWLHTCSFDHPVAIPNYLSRGFTIFKTERVPAALGRVHRGATIPSHDRAPLWTPSPDRVAAARDDRIHARRSTERHQRRVSATTRRSTSVSLTPTRTILATDVGVRRACAATMGARVIEHANAMPGARFFPDATPQLRREPAAPPRRRGPAIVFRGEGPLRGR